MRLTVRLATSVFLVTMIGGAAYAESAEELDFMSALKTIVQRDPNVGIQSAAYETARAKSVSGGLYALPTLSAVAKRSIYRFDDSTSSDASTQTSRGDLLLNGNLYRFGGDLSASRALDLELSIAQVESIQAVLDSEALAIKDISEYISSEDQVSVLQDLDRRYGELVEISKARYQRGLLPMQEVSKLEVDRSLSSANLVSAIDSRARAQRTLSEALGHSRIARVWPWESQLKPDRIEAWALQAWNPENSLKLRTARIRYDAASERKREARRKQYYPTLDFNGSLGYVATGATRGTEWNGVLSFSLPIFNQLSGWSEVQSKIQAEARADFERTQLERDSSLEWINSGESLLSLARVAVQRKIGFELAGHILEDSIKRLAVGRTDANQVQVDQSRVTNARVLASQAQRDLHQAFAQACHARGMRVEECLSRLIVL